MLRPYQVEGVNWLLQRYGREHGCVLGDEMGLGKTCQVCLGACLFTVHSLSKYYIAVSFRFRTCVHKKILCFQTIAFLMALYGGENVKGQHLILSPLSVLNNWLNELTR